MPVLLDAAADADADLAQAALSALARLPATKWMPTSLARLATAAGKNRQVLITLAGQRHIDRALPVIVSSAGDSDAGVRTAAVQAIGILGTDAQAADLVRLSPGHPKTPRSAATSRWPSSPSAAAPARAPCRPSCPLARNDDIALRIIALHVLASAGGPDALAAVQAAVEDKDETVQDEAVRTLSTWPNNWPEDSAVAEPLLALAKSDAKTSHQVLALRGYLQYLQANKQLKDDDKLSQSHRRAARSSSGPRRSAWPSRPSAPSPTPAALELLVTFAAEPAVAEDACSAIVKLAAAPMPGVPKDQRQKALQVAVDKSDQRRDEERSPQAAQGSAIVAPSAPQRS